MGDCPAEDLDFLLFNFNQENAFLAERRDVQWGTGALQKLQFGHRQHLRNRAEMENSTA